MANGPLLLAGLLVPTAAVAYVGVLVGQPALFLVIFAGLLFLLVFGEGSYQAWAFAEQRAASAEEVLAADHSRSALAGRLEDHARVLERMHAEIDSGERTRAAAVSWDYRAIAARVDAELRLDAPEYLPDWRPDPSDPPQDGGIQEVRGAISHAAGRLERIAGKLRSAT